MEEDRIYYVYDCVCTKEDKRTQILREYGDVQIRTENPSRDRLYRSEFAEEQRRRAAQAKKNAPSRPGYTGSGAGSDGAGASRPAGGASASGHTGGHAYTYRPGAAEGGEAAEDEKRRFDWFRKLFETLEEKGEQDVDAAKKAAVALRKIKEHRHAILTVLILLLVTALIAFGIYKLVFVIKNVSADGSELYGEEEILEASGVTAGSTLYSFSAPAAEKQITFRCPWVKSAKIIRTVPDTVSIAVEDDEAVFRANIWGDTVLMSGGLRVLEVLKNEEAPEGLIELVLPAVDKSVAGRLVAFTDERSERYIRNVLSAALKSELCAEGMLDQIDLTEEYAITMKACGKYNFKCGDEKEMDRKLKFAFATVTAPDFESGIRANIDLSVTGEASILFDFSTLDD